MAANSTLEIESYFKEVSEADDGRRITSGKTVAESLLMRTVRAKPLPGWSIVKPLHEQNGSGTALSREKVDGGVVRGERSRSDTLESLRVGERGI